MQRQYDSSRIMHTDLIDNANTCGYQDGDCWASEVLPRLRRLGEGAMANGSRSLGSV